MLAAKTPEILQLAGLCSDERGALFMPDRDFFDAYYLFTREIAFWVAKTR